jgi:hypothetical protein
MAARLPRARVSQSLIRHAKKGVRVLARLGEATMSWLGEPPVAVVIVDLLQSVRAKSVDPSGRSSASRPNAVVESRGNYAVGDRLTRARSRRATRIDLDWSEGRQ